MLSGEDQGVEELQIDDILTVYHPNSGREPEISHFEEYGGNMPGGSHSFNQRASEEPWRPFQSCLDFEVAELALKAALNKEQTNKLISLLHRAQGGKELFTLSSYDEVSEIWQKASSSLTSVCIIITQKLFPLIGAL